MLAAGKQRRLLVRPFRWHRTHEVHATVDLDQPPVGHTPTDLRMRKAGGKQLLPINDAVLLRGQSVDDRIGSSGGFVLHTSINPPVTIRAPLRR